MRDILHFGEMDLLGGCGRGGMYDKRFCFDEKSLKDRIEYMERYN